MAAFTGAVRSGAVASPTMPDITLTASNGAELRAYLATPAVGAGPWAGVVVVHDVYGLRDDTRVNADRLAAAGYVALAVDMFSRGGALRCLKATFGALRSGRGQAFDDVEAARSWLLARPDSNGRTAIIGFCMGGGFALMAAANGFDASAVNYGQPPKNLDEVLAGACPIVASYGARDLALKGAAPKVAAALDRAGIACDVKEYPGAGHSFLNRHNNGPFGPLERVLGLGYHQQSAEDAWRRILGFFEVHLRGGS
jgi:carboxymethylenebutenolidase